MNGTEDPYGPRLITAKIRVFVVSERPLLREALVQRIRDQADLEICGEDSAATVLPQIERLGPDVTIVDAALKNIESLSLVRAIARRFPAVRIMVLSDGEDSDFKRCSLEAGAHAFATTRDQPETLLKVIRNVAVGDIAINRADELPPPRGGEAGPSPYEPIRKLSDRELEVFKLIGLGLKTVEIAHRLHISSHTVDTHRENIRHKLGISDGIKLLRYAVQWSVNTANRAVETEGGETVRERTGNME